LNCEIRMSSEQLKLNTERVRNLLTLLEKNRSASIDEVKSAIEYGDKTIPFDPEVTIGMLPENLPVCQAVRAQRVDILQFLIEKYHADVNFTFSMTLIPAIINMNLIPVSHITNVKFEHFIVVACCNDYDLCCHMLSLVTKNSFQNSKFPNVLLLHLTQAAFTCVDIRILHALLTGVNTLPTDDDGRTCLHHVAMRCGASTDPNSPAITVLKDLAKVQASVNEFDDYGLTALQYACRSGSLAAVRVLLAAGADVNRYWAQDSCTALHLAVAAQSIDIVRELLHAGAKNTTEVLCDYVEREHVHISGDPSDVARAAGNFRLARYVADPLRSSLGVLLDSCEPGDGNSATAALMFEPCPGEEIHGTCSICLEETNLIPLGRCHHAFCPLCLQAWFRTSSNGVTRPQCPQSGCNVPVSIYDIKAVLGTVEASRVDQLLLQRSLAEMPDFRWCPRCSYGGFFEGPCSDAECSKCGYKFCTECQQEAHPGMTCQQKCSLLVDIKVGTTHWMSVNTKPCPACHVPICKNGGCSHMTCSRCHYQFCWYCLGKYQGVYTFEPKCPCPKRKTT